MWLTLNKERKEDDEDEEMEKNMCALTGRPKNMMSNALKNYYIQVDKPFFV